MSLLFRVDWGRAGRPVQRLYGLTQTGERRATTAPNRPLVPRSLHQRIRCVSCSLHVSRGRLSPRVLSMLCAGLAFGLLLRAVGDFRYVGFFKSVRGTRFATMDTWCYSPVCRALSIGVAYIAVHSRPQ